LKSLFGKKKLEDLPDLQKLKNDNSAIYEVLLKVIEYWAIRKASWMPAKQLYEATEIIDTFEEFTRMCFPEDEVSLTEIDKQIEQTKVDTQSTKKEKKKQIELLEKERQRLLAQLYEEDIKYLVSKKIQILLPGRTESDSSKERLNKILKKYSFIIETVEKSGTEVHSMVESVDEENGKKRTVVGYTPKSKVIMKGKVIGQAQGFPFIRILFPIYTDTNSGF
jgi:hypothetical protein